MQQLNLPLVSSLLHSYQGPDFSKVKIIGVQHILETTHAMFQALYPLGLEPSNISILGKCYSSCLSVYNEMRVEGIQVSEGSFNYCSHREFDELFSFEIAQFLSPLLEDISKNSYELVIVLDDGGKCIQFLNENLKKQVPLIAIEQTSSGYHAIKNRTLPFPVINVARAPTKLTLESPMIATAAAERLYKSLHGKRLSFDRALVIGSGAIGKAVYKQLSNEMDVSIYDQNPDLSDLKAELSTLLDRFPLLIGCTGTTSIPKALHHLLKPETTLVSVSSSDREFDAVHMRKRIEKSSICHQDLLIEGKLLLNSGFPINFDGDRENIATHLIQLTIALITAGILQARQSRELPPRGIISLDPILEEEVQHKFLDLNKCSP